MGFVGSLLGNSSGAGFQGQGVTLQQPVATSNAQTANTEAERGIAQQQAFANALNNQNGLGNQAGILSQQQGLANQLQAQTMGQGPNPAQAALAQNTGANVASQAALAAGQRGAAGNVGLMSRQIGQQGAGIQQNAVGQAATLQAQQQLAAQQQLQQQQAAMQNVAGQQVANTQTGYNALNQATQGNQSNLLGAIQGQNNANVSMQQNLNNVNASIAQGNQGFQKSLTSGLLGGLGVGAQSQVAGMMGGGGGGGVASASTPGLASSGAYGPAYAKGGEVTSGPRSNVGKHLHGVMNAKSGGNVPGKANVQGDSGANDTVPAMLSPGEIVVPRSAASNPDKAASFAKRVAMRKGKK